MANEISQPGDRNIAIQGGSGNTYNLNVKSDQPRTIPFMAEALGEFVQRPAEYDALRDLLLDENRAAPVAITAALKGAGGFGKTTLARALCHDPQVRAAFEDGILWVTLGENPTNILGSVEDLIFTLVGERPGFTNVQAAANRLKELLTNRAALVVIDDVWNNVHLTPFLQGGERCAYLITTRNADTLPAATKQIPVDAMQQREAVAVLAAGLANAEQYDEPFRALAGRLGEWPLLLKLVNGTLRDRVNNTYAGLAAAIDYANRALDKRGLTFFDVRNAEARHQAVALTLGVSLELLTEDERARYRALAVFPEDVEIPLPTLEKYWGVDDFTTEEICTRLMQMSLLLSYDATAQRIRLHDILRQFLIGQQRDKMPALHQTLLDTRRSFLPHSFSLSLPPWSHLPDDEPYFWEHLAQHLIEAGRGDELVATVKDWRYLAKKTFLRKSHAVEKDLLAAEPFAPTDDPLRTLRRSFVNSGHLFNHCVSQEDLKETVYVRLQHLEELNEMLLGLAEQLKTPHIEPQTSLPDLPHPALLRTLEGHVAGVRGCAMSLDGRLIVSASEDKTVKVWETANGKLLHSLEGHSWGVTGCAVSLDGRLIVSASDDKTVKVWETANGKLLHSLEGHASMVNGCAISPDGKLIVSASADQTLKVWEMESGKLLRTLKGHSEEVRSCAISPDGKLIISASYDDTVNVWETASGALLRTLAGHKGGVMDCAVSPGGRFIVSASGDKSIKIWATVSGKLLGTLKGHASWVSGCVISPDGRFIVSASWDHTLKVWETVSGALMHKLKGHIAGVRGCAMSPDGKLIVSASEDQTLKIWEAASGTVLCTLEGHSWGVTDCAVSHDGKQIVSSSYDGTLKIWEMISGKMLRTLACHFGSVMSCAVSRDSRNIVAASNVGSLKVWRTESGNYFHWKKGHAEQVNGCAISPDGNLFVSASADQTLKVWEMESGKLLRTLKGHSEEVRSCAISPDGKLIISASADQTLKVWEMESGKLLRTLQGHTSWVNGCAISPDGKLIVSGSEDRTLKVWETANGNCLATFYADGPLWCVTISNDLIATGGVTGMYFLRLVR
jgi:WD40 repeat protein